MVTHTQYVESWQNGFQKSSGIEKKLRSVEFRLVEGVFRKGRIDTGEK